MRLIFCSQSESVGGGLTEEARRPSENNIIAAAISPQVQGDLEEIFDCRWQRTFEQLSGWLKNLGIAPRDLRSSPAGLHQLQQALGSARGRNFVGSTA